MFLYFNNKGQKSFTFSALFVNLCEIASALK